MCRWGNEHHICLTVVKTTSQNYNKKTTEWENFLARKDKKMSVCYKTWKYNKPKWKWFTRMYYKIRMKTQMYFVQYKALANEFINALSQNNCTIERQQCQNCIRYNKNYQTLWITNLVACSLVSSDTFNKRDCKRVNLIGLMRFVDYCQWYAETKPF